MYLDLQKDPKRDGRTIIIVLLFSIAFLLIASKCTGQVYKVWDIPIIMNRTDSVSRLELLTAKKFHKKLNEYRKSKGICELRWSDTLYIMAMNHNMWMSYNKTHLMHAEIRNTAHFTGEETKDRMDYVCDTKTFGTSENCSWGAWVHGTIENMSETASLTAFNLLKDEPLHNAAMLIPLDRAHGVHISYKGGYCTSELCGNRIVKN